MSFVKYGTAATAMVAALAANGAQANIVTFFDTIRGTDFVSAGVGGLRGTGTGDIALSGVTGTVDRVFLYWHGPTTSDDPGFNATIMFNGTEITGENIGFSSDNFWGQLNSQAYRADVTDLVSGDGIYTLSGLLPDHSNGASLMAFFDDGNSANDRDIAIFNGNDSNFDSPFDPAGWDTTLADIDFAGGTASLQLHVSDGQDFGGVDGELRVNGDLLASDHIADGVTTPATPGTIVDNGSLWDILDFDITAFLDLGLNDLNVTLATPVIGDALSLISLIVDLPAGAAPPGPPPPPPTDVPAPPAAALLATGLVAYGRLRRRQRHG